MDGTQQIKPRNVTVGNVSLPALFLEPNKI
jgi:hypothetical protein